MIFPYRASFLQCASGEVPCSCLSQILEEACIPWLMTPPFIFKDNRMVSAQLLIVHFQFFKCYHSSFWACLLKINTVTYFSVSTEFCKLVKLCLQTKQDAQEQSRGAAVVFSAQLFCPHGPDPGLEIRGEGPTVSFVIFISSFYFTRN